MDRMREDARFRLRDGRTLAYAEWAGSDGPVVLFLNGTPGSRIWCPDLPATEASGCRLLTLDRPGYGRSDPAPPTMTLTDWTDDIAQLMDGLGIDRFALVGWSSGALYALACAAHLPDRLTAVGEVAGAGGPVDEEPGMLAAMAEGDRQVYDLARADPAAACRLAAEHASAWVAESRADPLSVWSDGAPSDRQHLEDPDWAEWMAETITESLRQGTVGYAWDDVTWLRPWGFRLEDLRLPIHIWHGGQDPWETTEKIDYLASRVADARVTSWPESGHLVVREHWSEILATLVA